MDWIATARDPRFKRPYTELAYLPMIELLGFLRASGFKTFIVSGGGIEFMRPWTERVYGVPPEQVVGSSIKTKFEMRDGRPELVSFGRDQFHRRQRRQASGHQRIYWSPTDRCVRQPRTVTSKNVATWTTMTAWMPPWPDRPSYRCRTRIRLRPGHILRSSRQSYLDAAAINKWTVVDMKNDWKRIFAFE